MLASLLMRMVGDGEGPAPWFGAGPWWLCWRCGDRRGANGRGSLFGGDFGDGGAGGGFVDDGFVRCVGRDEGLQGEVVHGAWEASAGLVDQVGGVLAEELVAAADEFEVVAKVVAGLGVGHAG